MNRKISGLLIILCTVLLLIILLRIFNLTNILYTDESAWAYSLMDASISQASAHIPHPPIGLLVYSLFGSIFFWSTLGMRLVPFFIGLLNTFLAYLLAKELFGKRTAVFSALLMLVSFWSFLAALQVDLDGSILALFFVATIYSFIRMEKTKSLGWSAATGILITLALLTKLSSILLVLILFIYSLFKLRNLKALILQLLIPGIVSFISLTISLIVIYIVDKNYLVSVYLHSSGALTSFSPQILAYFLVWGTILFSGLLFLSIFSVEKHKSLLYTWIAVPFIVYSFAIFLIAPFDRYLMITIPALAILGGAVISKIQFTSRNFAILCSSFAISLIFFSFLNLNTLYIPHNIANYASNILTMNWNFYLPITGSSGPTMGVSLSSIVFSFIIGGVALALAVPKLIPKKINILAVVIFLGVAFAFNFLLITELTFSLFHQDISQATYDAYAYVQNQDLPLPVFSNQLSAIFYLNLLDGYNVSTRTGPNYYFFTYTYGPDRLRDIKNKMLQGGTIVFIDYPFHSQDSLLWETFNGCTLNQTFSSKGKKIAYIYSC